MDNLVLAIKWSEGAGALAFLRGYRDRDRAAPCGEGDRRRMRAIAAAKRY